MHGTPPLAEAGAELTARVERDVTPLTGALYRQALRMTHNHADAEDLLQDTLVKAFGGFRTFRQGSNLNAWLHRILVNTYISGYRKAQHRPAQYPTDEISDLAPAAVARNSAAGLRSAEDQALDTLADTEVRAAMLALPEQFRTTVYYADVEGFRFKEIAELTDAPIGTVMSRLHRGRRQLRRLLAQVASDRGYHRAHTPYRRAAVAWPVPQTA